MGLPTAETNTAKTTPLFRARSLRSAETAQRRPKAVPSCENRSTLAALHKTSQRGLLAYKYTYPVPVESSQGHKLGNWVQPGVTDCLSRSYQPVMRATTRSSRAGGANSPCVSRNNDRGELLHVQLPRMICIVSKGLSGVTTSENFVAFTRLVVLFVRLLGKNLISVD